VSNNNTLTAGDRGGRSNRRPIIAARIALEIYCDARAAMALIREAVEAVRANSTPSRMTEMCDPVSVISAAEVTPGAASPRRTLFVGPRKVTLTGTLFALT